MTVRSRRGAVRPVLPALKLGCLVLFACSAPPSALAQLTTVRAELGASLVEYADTIRTSAISFTPELIAEWPLSQVRGALSVARLSSGGSSMQANIGLSLFTPARGPFLGELELYGGGTRTGPTSTSQVSAIARAHAATATTGAWLGGGVGNAKNGSERRPSLLGELGAWVSRGPTRASITISPVVVDDSVRYTDLSLAATAFTRRVELTASAGARSGTQPQIFGTPIRAWASASLVSWLRERISLVASAGRYPVDLTQGFPGGTYVSAGVRVATRHGALPEPPSRARPVPPAPLPADVPLGDMHVATTAGDRRLIYFRAPAAKRAEIAGSFTAWRPVALTQRMDGWWSLDTVLPAGRYEIAVRLDAGDWLRPPGLPRIRDEFGGEVGLLVIQ